MVSEGVEAGKAVTTIGEGIETKEGTEAGAGIGGVVGAGEEYDGVGTTGDPPAATPTTPELRTVTVRVAGVAALPAASLTLYVNV